MSVNVGPVGARAAPHVGIRGTKAKQGRKGDSGYPNLHKTGPRTQRSFRELSFILCPACYSCVHLNAVRLYKSCDNLLREPGVEGMLMAAWDASFKVKGKW